MIQATSLVIVLAIVAACLADTRLEIVLSARGLPDDADSCCSAGVYPTDGYAIVYYASSDFSGYEEKGRTSVLSDNVNPDWEEIFEFVVADNSTGRIKIDIMDSDVDSDDYIGYGEMTIQDILNASGYFIGKEILPSGNGRIRVAGRVNGSAGHEEAFLFAYNPLAMRLANHHARPTYMLN